MKIDLIKHSAFTKLFWVVLLISINSLATAAPSTSLKVLVEDLYKRYENEPSSASREGDLDGATLTDEKLVTLQEYFSHDLALAIWKDTGCTIKTHEICALGFVVLFDSQDPYVENLNISSLDEMQVRVCFQNYGRQDQCLLFKGEKKGSSYRIRDIIYLRHGGSLRKILSLPK
jgi:hypothetical protein